MVSEHKVATRSFRNRPPAIALPVAHLLALAPLDVWVRMLLRGDRGSRGVHPRYWLRLLGIGFTSLVGTMCSTPERLGYFIARLLSGGDRERFEHPPGVLIVVGYYRSGTTHAHNLLACDPSSVTPRWYQALLGQGYWLSWGITRFLLVPFLGSSRPQDGVGFGPMWPAEDDFALAGWGASSTLPGRLIFPSRWEHWSRYNTLEECSDAERAKWRRTVAGFAQKVTRSKPNAMLILKTPSHGAHIAQLAEVFGEHARFLHVARDPTKVIESNLKMHDALAEHLLQDPLDPTELRARIVREYHEIEHATMCQAQSLDEGRIGYMTHEELIKNPLGELSRALGSINMTLSDQHQRAIASYLDELGPYHRPPHQPIDLGQPSEDEADSIEQIRALRTHDRPSAQIIPLPEVQPKPPVRIGRGLLGAMVTAALWAALWIGIVWVIKQIDPTIKPRLDQLVWIGGSVIGLVAYRCAGGGGRLLGVTCAVLTLVVFLGVSFPVTVINWNFAADGPRSAFLYHNTKGALHGVLAVSSIAFAILGMLTAMRHAGDTGPRAPGL